MTSSKTSPKRSKKRPKRPKEPPKNERLDDAIAEYMKALIAYRNNSDPHKKSPSVRLIALSHGIIPSTLGRRVAGQTHSHQEASEDQQRLTPVEEQALKGWIFQVAEWGWPPKVSQVKFMATEMLVDKGDNRALGYNWMTGFLRRNSDLQSRFSQPLDQERAATHDPEVLLRWFQLVGSIIQKYDIQQADTYNMDETGFALGVTGRTRVICPRADLQIYVTQDGNREWTTLIECISADGRLLKIFMIFKGKQIKKAWTDLLEHKDEFIAMSETGWTNNVLGLEWFIRYVPHCLT